MPTYFDVESARKDGLSDSQIADYLSTKHNFDISKARSEGLDDTGIVDFLANRKIEGDTSILGEAGKGLKAGVQQLRGMGYGLTGLAGKAIGSDAVTSFASGRLKDVEAKTPPPAVGSYKDIESISDAAKYAAYGVAQNLPNLAFSVGAGGVGGILGKKLAGDAAKEVVKSAIRKGAAAGAGLSSIGMETGSIAGDQLSEVKDVDIARSLVGGIAAGALDFIPEWYLMKRLGWFGDEVKGTIAKRAATGFLKQAGMEAPTEAAQSVIERASVPGKSVTNAEAWDEYINSAILGGLTGGVVGGVGGMVPNKTQQQLNNDPTQKELDKSLKELDGEMGGILTGPIQNAEQVQEQVQEAPTQQTEGQEVATEQETPTAQQQPVQQEEQLQAEESVTQKPSITFKQDGYGSERNAIAAIKMRKQNIGDWDVSKVGDRWMVTQKQVEQVTQKEEGGMQNGQVQTETKVEEKPVAEQVQQKEQAIPQEQQQQQIQQKQQPSPPPTTITSEQPPSEPAPKITPQSLVSTTDTAVFARMPEDQLHDMAEKGVQGAVDEMGRRVSTVKVVNTKNQGEVIKLSTNNGGIENGKLFKQGSENESGWIGVESEDKSVGLLRQELGQEVQGKAISLGDITQVVFQKVPTEGKGRITQESLLRSMHDVTPKDNQSKTARDIVKEPWEMTEDEYHDYVLKTNTKQYDLMNEAAKTAQRDVTEYTNILRKKDIERAISEGKPIPPEVLKDYPDLSKNVPQYSRSQTTISSTKQPTSTPISISALNAVINNIKSTGISFFPNVITSNSQIPKPILNHMITSNMIKSDGSHDVQGVYYKGQVYLFPNNIYSNEEAAYVLSHELFHDGWYRLFNTMPGQLGAKYKGKATSILDDIWKSHSNEITDEVNRTNPQLKLDTISGKRQAANEWLAKQTYESQPKWYDKIVSMLRSFLRDIGIDIQFGDAEIRQLAVDIGQSLSEAPATTEQSIPTYIRRAAPDPTWTSPADSKKEKQFYNWADKYIDFQRMYEAIMKNGSTILTDDKDPLLLLRQYPKITADKERRFMLDEVFPLAQSMKKNNVTIPQINEYLWKSTAISENKILYDRYEANMIENGKEDQINPLYNDPSQTGLAGISNNEAQQYLDSFTPERKAQLDEVAKLAFGITRGTAELSVQGKLETRDTIDKYYATRENHIPYFREGKDPSDTTYQGMGEGFTTIAGISKRREGSTRAVVNPLANAIMQRAKILKRIEKNNIDKALVELQQMAPNADWWEVAVPRIRRVLLTNGQIAEEVDMSYRYDPNVIMARFVENENVRDEEGKIVKDENGNNVTKEVIKLKGIRFNDQNERAKRMGQALRNADMDQLGAFLEQSGRITRWISRANTQWYPIFGIKNFTRDTGYMLASLSTTPIAGKQADIIKLLPSALGTIYSDMRSERKGEKGNSKLTQAFDDFRKYGGQMGHSDVLKSAKEMNITIKSMMNDYSRHGRLEGVARKMESIKGWISDFNTTLENAVRLSSYIVGINNGMTPERAAHMASGITVDFSKRGSLSAQAGALFAFFNASAQSAVRTYEIIKGPAGKKIVLGGLMLGAMNAMIIAAAGFDNEPPEFIKERNILIPTINGQYIPIPLPLGLNVFPNMGRIIMESIIDSSSGKSVNIIEKLISMLAITAESFNPLGGSGFSLQTISPTPFDPLVGLAENLNWNGQSIYREDYSSLNPTPGYKRGKDNAQAIGLGLAYVTNMITGGTENNPGKLSPTPEFFDYLAGQFTGGIGREGVRLQNLIASMIKGEEVPLYNIPLVGGFYGTTEGKAQTASKFYDNVKLLNRHENEIKGLRDARKPITEYIASHPEARYYMAGNRAEASIRNLMERKRTLEKRDAPEENIKAIDAIIQNRMKQLNDLVEKTS